MKARSSRGMQRYGKRMLLATTLTMLGAGVGIAMAEQLPSQPMGFGAMPTLDQHEMESARGKDGIHIFHVNAAQSIQNMSATVINPNFQVINGDMVSGNITFENNAMGFYSGTGIFNAITGMGNAVNNAIGISVVVGNISN